MDIVIVRVNDNLRATETIVRLTAQDLGIFAYDDVVTVDVVSTPSPTASCLPLSTLDPAEPSL